jgi:hypothetical protein
VRRGEEGGSGRPIAGAREAAGKAEAQGGQELWRARRKLDPQAAASKLEAQITPADRAAWTQGDARTWAMESYGVARSVVYSFNPPPGCAAGQAPVALPDGYADKATVAAEVQLQKAGVRLAWVLNTALR